MSTRQGRAIAAFKIDLRSLSTSLEASGNEGVRDLALKMAENIVVGGRYAPGTPVDVGVARGGWYPVMNSKPAVYKTAADRGGSNTLVAIHTAFKTGRMGDLFELWTNVTYVVMLERGSSKQARRGMVRLTMRAGQQMADDVVRERNRG